MQKEIAEQQAAEREVLNKIKEKMERIKASQQHLQSQQSREPASHYEGKTQVGNISYVTRATTCYVNLLESVFLSC